MLAHSLPQPHPRSCQTPPLSGPHHASSTSSFHSSSLAFDAGSNPHLTPRYSQGVAALSHQADSASSQPTDTAKSAQPLPSTLLCSPWFSASTVQSHSHSHQHTRPSSTQHRQRLSQSEHQGTGVTASSVRSSTVFPHGDKGRRSVTACQSARMARPRAGGCEQIRQQHLHADAPGDSASHGLQTASPGKSFASR